MTGGAEFANGFGALQPAFRRAELGATALDGQAEQSVAVLDAELQAGGPPTQRDASVVEPCARAHRIDKVDDGVSQFRHIETFVDGRRDAVAGEVPADDVKVVAKECRGFGPENGGRTQRRTHHQKRIGSQFALRGKQHRLDSWLSHEWLPSLGFRCFRLAPRSRGRRPARAVRSRMLHRGSWRGPGALLVRRQKACPRGGRFRAGVWCKSGPALRQVLEGFVDDGLQLLLSVLTQERGGDGGRHTFAEQQRSRDLKVPAHRIGGEDPDAFGELAEVPGCTQGQREQLPQGRPLAVPGAVWSLVVEGRSGQVQL